MKLRSARIYKPRAPLRLQSDSHQTIPEYPCLLQTHNHQTRTRRSERFIETGVKRPLKHDRLTEKNLKALEKMGRTRKDPQPKSSRSEPNSFRSQATSKPSTTTESTNKTVSTTDSSFPRLAFENGILDPVSSEPPANLESRQKRINRRRDSASPSESDYRKFVYKIRTACNEQTVLLQTSQLLKEYDEADSGYNKIYNQAFTTFPKNVGLNNGLSAAQPDMVEGLNIREFNPFPVRQELSGATVPTLGPYAITLPHLAGEWKGPGKDMIEAQTQAAYDGACMVYGRNEARSFLENPDPVGYAFVSTFTTDGTTLNTFDHYSSESQDGVKYYQYPTSNTFLIATYDDFKKSRRRLRNLQDNAKETSEKLRDKLNEKWSANHRSPIDPTDGNKS